MATLSWNDLHQSVGRTGKPDGRFVINSITDATSGVAEWFLSEGPLDQAPAPCDTLDEAKALAQAIVDGPKALAAFEAPRTAAREAARGERRAAQRRDEMLARLDDPDVLDVLRERLGLAKGDG